MGKSKVSENLSTFDSFQLEEYKNLSNSHYESVKQVTVFFRYYLLILSAPIFILTLIDDRRNEVKTFFNGTSEPIFYNLIFSYFIIISIIGFFIFYYVINLRQDAILYARSVNKVRKYFYHNSGIKNVEYEQFANLPLISSTPKYFERIFFTPLLLVFSLINCSFFAIALNLRSFYKDYFIECEYCLNIRISMYFILIVSTAFMILHYFLYKWLAYKRNNIYLKNYAIGVDIDGVLNDQTKHFVKWLKKLTGKKIDPKEIKEIPVHLNKSLDVSSIDERIVFNTKEYWETLPLKENAYVRLNHFQKVFGYRINIYSYRSWPQYNGDKKSINNLIVKKGYTPLKELEIKKISKKWLIDNNILEKPVSGCLDKIKYFFSKLPNKTLKYKSIKTLTIETGNPFISDSRFSNRLNYRILNNNRFQDAKKKGFRFFIEDSPENAIKLSDMCDYVFLFNEPYNSDKTYILPRNIIRVNHWDEIYSKLKLLS